MLVILILAGIPLLYTAMLQLLEGYAQENPKPCEYPYAHHRISSPRRTPQWLGIVQGLIHSHIMM